MSSPQTIAASRRPSVLQSPWYWVHAFCSAGLIALVLLGGKASQRQAQIERGHQGRQRAAAIGEKDIDYAELSTPDSTIVSLQPLYFLLAAGLIVSGVALWRTHFRRPPLHEAP
jgi:hypothetical protein